MGPYRSDLETAHARIASLERAVQRVEEDRARLERGLRPQAERSSPWRVIAVVGISCATLVGIVSLSQPSPEARRPRAVDAREPTPTAPAPEPAPVGPPREIAPVVDAPLPPPIDEIAPTTPVDSVFIGQYWEARVTSTGAHGPPVDTRCLITMAPGAYRAAGIGTVRCGDTMLQVASITPPSRGEERSYCWFDGRDLYCAPPDSSVEVCWINTGGHVARCPRGVELSINTILRDPREEPPPQIL